MTPGDARPLPRWTRLIEPVLTYIAYKPGVGFAELQRVLGTTVSILGRALQELRSREQVRLQGARRDARYYLGGPLLRVAGPLPTVLHPPPTATERAWIEERLAWLHVSMGKVLAPAVVRKTLDALERDFRRVQPGVAANDPLAGLLLAAIEKITLIRRHRFGPA